MSAVDELRSVGSEVQLEGDDISFRWARAGRPDASRVRPLLDDIRQHKGEALDQLRQQGGHGIARGQQDTRDPFSPRNQLPPGLIITLPDPDRSGWWIARRTGSIEPAGRGPDQVAAILDLGRLEDGPEE